MSANIPARTELINLVKSWLERAKNAGISRANICIAAEIPETTFYNTYLSPDKNRGIPRNTQRHIAVLRAFSENLSGRWKPTTDEIARFVILVGLPIDSISKIAILWGIEEEKWRTTFKDLGLDLPILNEAVSPRENHAPYTMLLYRQGQIAQLGLDLRGLGMHLYEWKIVHTGLQAIYLEVSEIELKLYMLDRTSKAIEELIKSWLGRCEFKLKRLARGLKQLEQARDDRIDELCELITNRSGVLNSLYELITEDELSFRVAQREIYLLRHAIDEVLKVADHNISEIADIVYKGY